MTCSLLPAGRLFKDGVRSGMYFSGVNRVRDEVAARGRHPSIDAVRAVLGETGSRTTILKHVRKTEVEEGGATQAVSDAILALAPLLAEQLKRNATAELTELRARMDDRRGADEGARSELKVRRGEARRALQG
ncbi:DNA-binding protein [Massilia sp. UMI-21]|nr:DNA-binding protein [Massilia sp. UMI-21]